MSLSLPAGRYELDPTHSRVGFAARHALVTKVRGSFDVLSGVAHLDPRDPARAEVSVVIATASVNTHHAARDEHLRSSDFFDAASFPNMTYVAHGARLHATGVALDGALTVKGVEHPLTLELDYTGSAVDPYGNERHGFEGQVVVDRRDLGLTWNAAMEAGGLLVSEKVTLEFDVSAIRRDLDPGDAA